MKYEPWKTRAALAAACLLAAAPAVQASLIGDSVDASLQTRPGTWGVVTQSFAPSATVGAGLEFSGQWSFVVMGELQQAWDIGVDIDGTRVTVTAHESTDGSNNIYAYSRYLFQITLSDLDLGQALHTVQLVSGLGSISGPGYALDVVRSSHTDDSLTLQWFNLPFGSANLAPHGGSWVFELNPTPAAAPGSAAANVPEPGSALLATAALGALATASWRRRRRPG